MLAATGSQLDALAGRPAKGCFRACGQRRDKPPPGEKPPQLEKMKD